MAKGYREASLCYFSRKIERGCVRVSLLFTGHTVPQMLQLICQQPSANPSSLGNHPDALQGLATIAHI